ncbi:hypothetical protein ABMX52_22500, partial [Vibrio vulnificus]
VLDPANARWGIYITQEYWDGNALKLSDVQQEIDAYDARWGVSATIQELSTNGTIDKANSAQTWVDAANANITDVVTSYVSQPGGINDQLEDADSRLNSAQQEIDALEGSITQTITSLSDVQGALGLDEDAGFNDIMGAYKDFLAKQEFQEQKISFAYAEQKISANSTAIASQAQRTLELAAFQNEQQATLTQVQRAIATQEQALTDSVEQLTAKIETDDAEVLASANEYTRAAVGYCVDAQGNITSETDAVLCVQAGHNWIQGPLAEYIRNLSIQNAAGETATISDMMQAFENEEGKLIVRGGMTVNNQGKISGFVNTNDGTLSQTDFIADFFRIGTMNGENFEPVFGLDSVSRKLVLKGRLILDDGSLITNKDELQGKDGTIWGTLKLRDGIFPSDALATADFTARYGRAPILDDMLTYVSNDGSVSSTKSYNGAAWVAPALRLSGDLITPGTIFGDRFVAGSELTSPVIKGGEAYFGKEVGAPFDGYHTKISPDGLIQTDRIQATGGDFDNVTIGENCEILGTLKAGQIVGDIARPILVNLTEEIRVQVNRGSTENLYLATDIDIVQAD